MNIIAALPCFNTADSIADVVNKTANYVDQVIVVDDGSTDNTALIAKNAGALVVSHGINQGYGMAISTCFKSARYNNADILVIIDGDGQHNPEDIPKLIKPVLEDGADLVIGSRFLPDNTETDMPKYRGLGIRTINFVWNFGSKCKITDSQSGFRAYSKKTIEQMSLAEKGMGVSIEVLENSRGNGVIIKEVPISCLYPVRGISIKAFQHGISVVLSVLRIRLSQALR